MCDSSKNIDSQFETTQDARPPKGAKAAAHPTQIGRYRILRHLGSGGFGHVFLARDEVLCRQVAVKLPHVHLVGRRDAVQQYVSEARAAANQDHPHIVPVYDIGQTEEHPCYVVSKFIEGEDLAARLRRGSVPLSESHQWAACIAEALHQAHKHGLVHRDVKPANILIDGENRVYLADFGLALWEYHSDANSCTAGTPAYMSPEQARGESHLVDGRSDIFSLGVVLYEMLCGHRPFQGRSIPEVLAQIRTRDPKPLRQWNEAIPSAIEGVCLKALAKRPSERYTTAHDFAHALRLSGAPVSAASGAASEPLREHASVLHALWDALDPQLQDAFSLAYNKKRRDGKNRISTNDLFQALLRVGDHDFQRLQESLPAGSLPEAVDAQLPADRFVLQEVPQFSDCVSDSLQRYRRIKELPRKISCADIFVDIGKHGHGPSVVRLRNHGVTATELDRHADTLGLNLIRSVTSQ